MTFEFEILSAKSAIDSDLHQYDAIISISDPEPNECRPADIRETNSLCLDFCDTDRIDAPEENDEIKPIMTDIESLVSFIKNNEDKDSWMFHCLMGRRRSSAAALIFLAIRLPDISPEDLADLIEAKTPKAQPNTLMCDLAARHLSDYRISGARKILKNRSVH